MNSITITGNLGKECETRALSDGTPVVSFSVADTYMKGGDKHTIWWNCALFGKRGESLAPYLSKGQQVTVIGSVTEREWTDKDGQKRKSMDVRVNDIALQGGKPSGESASAPRQAPKPRASGDFSDMDSDIPFANPMRGAAKCLAM